MCFAAGSALSSDAQPIAVRTLELPVGVSDIAWDQTRSRFFVSSWTDVLIVNPETAQIEETIPIGDYADKIAISDDGQFLYVALRTTSFRSLSIVNRYRLENRTLDLQIPLGDPSRGSVPRGVWAMEVLPGQPSSLLIASTDEVVMVFDDDVARPATVPLRVLSLYARPSDGAVFAVGEVESGFNNPRMFSFSLSGDGVSVAWSVRVDINWDASPMVWTENLAVTRRGFVFDLNARATIGTFALPVYRSGGGTCLWATDASDGSAIAYEFTFRNPETTTRLVQYRLKDFRPTASVEITGLPTSSVSLSSPCRAEALIWGTDGLFVGDGTKLYFLNLSGLSPLSPETPPSPTRDPSGVIHLALPANGLVYDSWRHLL